MLYVEQEQQVITLLCLFSHLSTSVWQLCCKPTSVYQIRSSCAGQRACTEWEHPQCCTNEVLLTHFALRMYPPHWVAMNFSLSWGTVNYFLCPGFKWREMLWFIWRPKLKYTNHQTETFVDWLREHFQVNSHCKNSSSGNTSDDVPLLILHTSWTGRI